jgi:hypothetical protein
MAERELAILLRARDMASKTIGGVEKKVGGLGRTAGKLGGALKTASVVGGAAIGGVLVGGITLGHPLARRAPPGTGADERRPEVDERRRLASRRHPAVQQYASTSRT